jgi:hypothetical protein
MTRTNTLLSALGCVLLMSACAHPQAKTAPDGPPLDMPAPPAREVGPADAEVPAPMPLPEEPAHRALPASRRAEPPKTDPKRELPKPDPVADPPRPTEEPQKPPAAPPPAVPTTPVGEDVDKIRESIDRANAALGHIDYRVLNTDARNQYDTAKRFAEQAEDAIRAKNLAYAKTLADKAAALAAKLARK